jgi:hypothetical protein
MTERSLFERSVHNMDQAVRSQGKSYPHTVCLLMEVPCTYKISPVGTGETSGFIRENQANDKKWKSSLVPVAHSDIPTLFSYLPPRHYSIA